MTAARWQQVKQIVASALGQTTSSERADYLATACANDTSLRREVDSLLADSAEAFDAFATAGGFLQRPELPCSYSGRRIGAYKLVRELGRGGMGSVWLGERVDQRFEQKVAIKLLKRGHKTDELLARFQDERRILARLDHPAIARLFDGGETEDGLPFFIMEYLADAESITTFAEEHKLSTTARIELFREVCRAIQFAHQHLVIHRDLKPGNILITPSGEPKLVDFGIARLVGTNDSGGAETSSPATRSLTLTYASPEQRDGAPITTATDIYSLGLVLHELLTGKLPAEVTSNNTSTPRSLNLDLECIVARATHRDPNKRYATANGLAEDLRRYLNGRPVLARRSTVKYRATKFLSRHHIAVGAAALYAVVLLAATIYATQQAYRAKRRFAEVQSLSHSVLFEIHDAIRDLPGSTSARRLIINRALQYLGSLAHEASGDSNLQLELASAYLRVGDVQGKPYRPNVGDSAGALNSYEHAAELSAAVVASDRRNANAARAILSQAYESEGAVLSRLNNSEEAIRYHRQAIALREELLQDDPARREEWQRGIITDELGLGDAVVSANRVHPVAGYQRSALQNYKSALARCDKLVAAHPESKSDRLLAARICSRIAVELSELSADEHDQARFAEALRYHARATQTIEEELRREPAPPLQRMLSDELTASAYSRALAGAGLDEAMRECLQARESLVRLAQADPSNAEAQQDLSSSYFVQGRVFQAQHDFSRAAEAYRHCLAILEPLVHIHSDNVETVFDLARARDELRAVSSSDARSPAP